MSQPVADGASPGAPTTPSAPLSPAGRFPQRCPFLPAAACLAAGIAADRIFNWPLAGELTVAMLSLLAAVAFWSRPRMASTGVAVALAGCGALRHHQLWSARPPEDLSRIDLQDDSPIRIVGVVESPVEIRREEEKPATPGWMLLDRSSFDLRAVRLLGVRDLPVAGLVRVDVSGHLPAIEIGDRLEILGHIRVPGEPRDPHGFDMRTWLRSRGIDRGVTVEHPAAVVQRGDASTIGHQLARARHRLRAHCERLLADHLSPDVRGVGTSLLLGTRTGITEEIRDAFIESGTMHLLAISGLHVAILAGLVLAACRLAGVSTGSMMVIVLCTLWGYTLVTDLRPPVLRSALFGSFVVAAAPTARQATGFNLLAATAFLLLLWNPNDLFDLGAQLSFLAVAAIMWSARLLAPRRGRAAPDPLAGQQTLSSRAWKWTRRKAIDGYAVTAAIWLFTLPLTLAWFRLFSPIGFLINVVLVPFSGPLLAAGFSTLAIGLIAPPLAWLPAAAYDACLRLLMVIVGWSAGTPFSHVSMPGPATWQLIWFYGVLAAAAMLPWAGWRRRMWITLACSVAVMLAWASRPTASSALTLTFLDVGHGGAILFQFPAGEAALFDAGSFGRGEAVEETIHRALQDRRVHSLNALILSHADADHYNAAAGLINRIPVGVVYVSQAFPDMSQPSVAALCDNIARAEIPLRLVQAGDRFDLSGDCRLEVLHPAGTFRDRLDNAHSIVLRAEFAGRNVLVTGDVEKGGVRALLETHPAGRVDIFQSPHHGGRASNTTDLARWALPRFVVVCNRDDSSLPHLRDVYRDAERILTSAGQGTVTAVIPRNGEIRLSTARGGDE